MERLVGIVVSGQTMVIVTSIRQKLSNIEQKKMLIVTNYLQLFSEIFGDTLLIVTHIWRHLTCRIRICSLYLHINARLAIIHSDDIIPQYMLQVIGSFFSMTMKNKGMIGE